MKKIIIIKYGELTTKKDNINLFLKTLKQNIENKLLDLNVTIKYDQGRMFIIKEDNNYEEVLKRMKYIFGIHEYFIGYELDNNDLDNIKNNVLNLLQGNKFKTFKVETKRSDKSYPITSMEMDNLIGGHILKNISTARVDIHTPEIIIYLEIRINKAYIYFHKENGINGYPVGTLGKGLLMLSGGIDSPVAGYLSMKRGIKLECIYFESPPHTSEAAKEKVISLATKLSEYGSDIKIHVINFTEIQESIYKNIPHDYLITIMRRMMYRISEILAHKINAKAIINGESVGQVASQTLTSMKAINEVTNMPVLRPLAMFDKLEIIDIATKIETYDISILPYEDCCTIFVPQHPVINPDIQKVKEYETLIDYQNMIYKCIKERQVLTTKKDVNDLL